VAKYKEMSVAKACNYLLNGWSLDGVWMDYDDDDAEGGAARAYDCNGKLWAMGYSFTPGSDPGPVTGYCRMLREACALRAVRHLVGRPLVRGRVRVLSDPKKPTRGNVQRLRETEEACWACCLGHDHSCDGLNLKKQPSATPFAGS
jgi:hypothetical protein